MEKLKRFLLMLMCLAVVLSTVTPAMMLTAQAASYVATGTLNTKVRLSDFETDSIDGQTHTPRRYHFTNVKGAQKVENRQAYCINITVGFIDKDLSAYKGYLPPQSTFFNSLSANAKKGIVLVAAFGYPSNTYKSLGASNTNEAIAATQILMWEFLTNKTEAHFVRKRASSLVFF